MFGANFVIPAQIFDELSCGQSKVYKRMDGWTDRREMMCIKTNLIPLTCSSSLLEVI